VEKVVASGKVALVYFPNLWVYPTGFEFDLVAVPREGETLFDPWDFEVGPQGRRDQAIPPEKLRIGLEFADGSSVTNIRGAEWGGSKPKPPKLSTRGVYGEDRWEQSYWVWPLPPPGPLALVCEWPAAGISLTRLELDAQSIIDAAARAQAPFESR
jgi:hypothetical protein